MLYCQSNPIHVKTYERYIKSKNLGFCFQPISIPSNITRQYQKHIKNPVELLRRSYFTKIVNGYLRSLTGFSIHLEC